MVAAIEIKKITRSFSQGGRTIKVLRGASLSVEAGEIIGILGQSGSGKSTMLQIAGLLEKPDSGDVVISGNACGKMDDDKRTEMRRHHLGFVYQFHHLLPEFSAIENVVLPQRIADKSKVDSEQRAKILLSEMGLAERLDHRPSELSGGEQQRVAIARALANEPQVLLADEPTGNLDEATADKVMSQLIKLIHQKNVAAIIATHNLDLASRMDRCFYLQDGQLHQR